MKIAVYGIAKNESKHVERFMNAIWGKGEADAVYILDTGSDDGTPKLLDKRGAIVEVRPIIPWRFDVARNIALTMVPNDVDVCLSLDLDEVPTPGWRAAIEKDFKTPWLYYKYVWNHNADGSDGVTLWKEKCHTRHGWHWVHPVHEILRYTSPDPIRSYTDGFVIHHWADDSKPRTSYLPLLELAVTEDPDDDRNAHYLGREYHAYGRHDEAIRELQRHLSLPRAVWEPERAASMRFLARAYAAKGDNIMAWKWAMRACAEAPREREPWIELGRAYNRLDQHQGCYFAIQQALNITERPMSYINEPESWGSLPYDLMGVSAWYLGKYEEARGLMTMAIGLDPSDGRLRENLRSMK